MNVRALIIFGIFTVTVILLLFLSLFWLVKRHAREKDSKFLTNLKIFLGLEQEKNSINQYFSNADKILKYFLKNSSNYQYELPWYISFGAADSGKTSFFANVLLETPIQLNYTDTFYINHYFFNEGVILDLKSELIFNDSSYEFSWDRLLNKLKDMRSMKPIDGIVYFVSLKDLMSNDADKMLRNKKDFEILYQKLWQLQSNFEMRLPVYIVFTHLDYVSGFGDFIETFGRYKDDIFGWSNPFSLDVKFSDEWLDNLKITLNEELKVLLSEVMVNFEADISFNIMNFINNFQDLYAKISEFLSVTFHSNKYTKGLYLRGVYFSALDTSSVSYEKIPQLQNEEASISGGYQVEQANIFFAKDLLVKKVFAEKDIGKEDVDKKRVDKDVHFLKHLVGIFALTSSVYSVKLYRELSFALDLLYPKTLKVVEVLKEYDKDKTYLTKRESIEELKIVLQFLGDLSGYPLVFKGVPSSLFSSIDKAKNNLLLTATKKLVVTTLFNEIEAKFIKGAKFERFETHRTSVHAFMNPLSSLEFKNLQKIVDLVAELEEYEQKFISFKENNSVFSLAWLLERILNVKMPASFEKSIIFSLNMDLGDLDSGRLYSYKKDIKKKFRIALNKFVINCFSKDKINQYFMDLQSLLFLIESGDPRMSYDNLRSVQKYLAELITLFNQSDFEWLRSKHFSSPAFETVLKAIERSIILGGEDSINEILTRTATSFYGFKHSLSSYQLPLLGCPFYNSEDKVCLSKSILELQGFLNDIFSESFMESVPRKNFSLLNSSQAVIWDINTLRNVVSIIDEYNSFIEKPVSSKTDLIVQNIANKNIANLIKYQLVKGHKVVALDVRHAHLSDQADNVKNSVESINKILEFLQKLDITLFKEVKDIQKDSLLNFLSFIDRAMQMEDLYDIKEEMFLVDTANKKLFFNFNLMDYLNAQKKQVEFFAVILAADTITALEKIYFLDSLMLNDLVIKWKDIQRHLENHKVNPANSKLFTFEDLSTKVQTSSLKDLFEKDLKKFEANLNKDSFFETKVFILHQRINSVVESSISRILANQYNESFAFYKDYADAFPFNLTGNLIGVSGHNKMQELIHKQEDIVALVKVVKPNYDSPVFRFIENLGRLNQMVSFLLSSDKCFVINFKQYQPIGDLYEKNLKLVVFCTAKVNGQKSLDLYKPGQLKIYDLVEFEVCLAKNSGKKISLNQKPGHKVRGNRLILNFDKHQLMRFLIENCVEINKVLFIRFTIDIEDDKGIKDTVVVMIPVEFSLDGVKYDMPDRIFTKISQNES